MVFSGGIFFAGEWIDNQKTSNQYHFIQSSGPITWIWAPH